MARFPVESVKASQAIYQVHSGPFELASISIRLNPFEFNGETLDTSLSCDHINIDLSELSALAGKTFQFPPNPEPGYIDGSIYMFGRHLVFLTHCLSFGVISDGAIPLKVEGTLEFSCSGSSSNENVSLSLETALDLPLTAEQLTAMAEDAIIKTGAQSSQDIGKVMAFLAKSYRANNRMAELNTEVRSFLSLKS